jgi:hypothetical protein
MVNSELDVMSDRKWLKSVKRSEEALEAFGGVLKKFGTAVAKNVWR